MAQGIAPSPTEGLAAVQGMRYLSGKSPSRFPRIALLVGGDQACRSLSSLYSSVLFGSVCLCVSMCENPAGYNLGLLFGALGLGENFLSQPFQDLLGVYELETKC